jgi:hypothetical protein
MHGHLASKNTADRVALLFTVKDSIGALEQALNIIKGHNISLTHIESRPSKSNECDYDFFVEFQSGENSSTIVNSLVDDLKKISANIQVVATGEVERENGSLNVNKIFTVCNQKFKKMLPLGFLVKCPTWTHLLKRSFHMVPNWTQTILVFTIPTLKPTKLLIFSVRFQGPSISRS